MDFCENMNKRDGCTYIYSLSSFFMNVLYRRFARCSNTFRQFFSPSFALTQFFFSPNPALTSHLSPCLASTLLSPLTILVCRQTPYTNTVKHTVRQQNICCGEKLATHKKPVCVVVSNLARSGSRGLGRFGGRGRGGRGGR